MRFVIAFLAILGVIVSGLALHVHFSNDLEPCDINSRWDCGAVIHSRYSEFYHVPVAAIGIPGYLSLTVLALQKRHSLTLAVSIPAAAFALALSGIEAYRLQTWCLYCVISRGVIALIAILSFVWFLREVRIRRERI